MQLIPFTNRHSRFADEVDAFVDGELRGQALEDFQNHIGSCARCATVVAAARTLKASLASLPQGGAPRSFALTPAMAASEARERLPALVTTPMYLTVARAAAVVSVVAFVAVFTLSILSGDSESTDQQLASNAAERNSAPEAADAAGGAAFATSSADSTNTYALGSPTVLLAPATSGAVSGAGAPTSTPAPPSTGAQPTPLAPQPNDGSAVPKSTGPGADALGDAVFEPLAAASRDDDSSGIPWTILTGCVAGVLVGVLLVAASRRRRS